MFQLTLACTEAWRHLHVHAPARRPKTRPDVSRSNENACAGIRRCTGTRNDAAKREREKERERTVFPPVLPLGLLSGPGTGVLPSVRVNVDLVLPPAQWPFTGGNRTSLRFLMDLTNERARDARVRQVNARPRDPAFSMTTPFHAN